MSVQAYSASHVRRLVLIGALLLAAVAVYSISSLIGALALVGVALFTGAASLRAGDRLRDAIEQHAPDVIVQEGLMLMWFTTDYLKLYRISRRTEMRSVPTVASAAAEYRALSVASLLVLALVMAAFQLGGSR